MDELNDAGCHLAAGFGWLPGPYGDGECGPRRSRASPSEQGQEQTPPTLENDNETKPPSGSVDNDSEGGSLPPNETEDEIAELMNNMTVEEKVGQLVLVGLEGTAMDETSRKLVKDHHVGGFILFKDNIESVEQSVKLLNDLKEANTTNPVPCG